MSGFFLCPVVREPRHSRMTGQVTGLPFYLSIKEYDYEYGKLF